MADDSEEIRGWLVEPPGPGQVVVHIAAGEGVVLDDAQRTALEALLSSLQQADEVAGFESPCIVVGCKPKVINEPCAWHQGTCTEYSACIIQQLGRFY
jgi:hypothetical protein